LQLLKSFIGTGVLFLGKASVVICFNPLAGAESAFNRFYNGGILFSSVVIVSIAMISLYSFLLLVKTKFVVSGSFGGTDLDLLLQDHGF
jgi:solute carrier family 36 (proton-coupled amino acid transporter)